MKFLSKSAFYDEQILDRSLVITDMEIQLLNSEVEYPTDWIYHLIKNQDIKIEVIHMPLTDSGIDYDLKDTGTFIVLQRVVALANSISKAQNGSPIRIVCHYSGDPDNDENLMENLFSLLESNPNIIIVIENCSSLEYKKGRQFSGRNACYINNSKLKFANIELANRVQHPRCKICLDTCHLLMTQSYFNFLKGYLCDDFLDVDILKEAFTQASGNLGLVHLSNCKEHGYGMGFHGTAYVAKKNIGKLKSILKLIEDAGDCPVTIETCEVDINKAENLRTTLETIKEIDKGSNAVPDAPETEVCVMCGQDTGIPVSLPVDFRTGYIEGAGQLCSSCLFKFSK